MSTLAWVLAGGLATALVTAAFTDLRSRTIPNPLNAGIALAAPLWWWSVALPLWPGVAVQLAVALVLFVLFAAVFALGGMGGGDVKLIAALSLWLPAALMPAMLFVMALAGLVLTLAMFAQHTARLSAAGAGGAVGAAWRSRRAIEVPYGVAIVAGGLWALSRTVF